MGNDGGIIGSARWPSTSGTLIDVTQRHPFFWTFRMQKRFSRVRRQNWLVIRHGQSLYASGMNIRKFATITVLVLAPLRRPCRPHKAELEAMYDKAFREFNAQIIRRR